MDIPVSPEIIRRRKNKKIIIVSAAVLILALLVFLFRNSFLSTLHRGDLTIAEVKPGNVENTIAASGLLQPEFEQVISCPVNSSIERVLAEAGAVVKEGDPLLALDKSAIQTEYEKLRYENELKRSNIQKIRLEIGKSYYDLKSNNDIKQYQINSLQAAVENAKKLYKAGGGTKEDIEQAELKLKVAQLEKKQLENEIATRQKTMQEEIRQSEIQASIQGTDLNEYAKKLQQAEIKAGRSGVLTWINKNTGSAVHEGDELAHIADLGSFKVVATIADNYIGKIQKGMQVIVRINDSSFRGLVGNIYPAVQNGFVSFDVQLDDKSNKLFRPNMKVDVFVVTEAHTNVMRVANGPAFNGAAVQDIFVINGNRALRRKVHIGLSNFDYVEIKDNVNAGDKIIISDMSSYKNVDEIKIKDQ